VQAEVAEVGAAESPRWVVPTAHIAVLLAGMRISESVLWPRDFDPLDGRKNLANLRRAYSSAPVYDRQRPLLESDGDPWIINGVGHALFGSEVYARMRQCAHSPLASVGAAALTTVLWEYGIEAPHKPPSAIDLVWTPVAGALLGEGRYRLHRFAHERPGARFRLLAFAVDPFGEFERRVLLTGC
jgi:hypothetical protein